MTDQRRICPCPVCTEERLAMRRRLQAVEAERDALRDALRRVQEDFRQRPAPGDGADAWLEWQYHAGRTFGTCVAAALAGTPEDRDG